MKYRILYSRIRRRPILQVFDYKKRTAFVDTPYPEEYRHEYWRDATPAEAEALVREAEK